MSSTLAYILNPSILQSTFPTEWKVARVTPIYKNGTRSLPENYRPISVLPAVSKLMERFIYDEFYDYLKINELLSPNQFGFRKCHSTATALLDATNSWYLNMDRGLLNLVVFVDLKKSL